MRKLAVALMGLALMGGALGQPLPYASQRPGGAGSDPLESPRDLTGRSLKTPRIRVIHSRTLPGGSGWLMEHDPWLAYQWGRDLGIREFSQADGAFGEAGFLGGKTLDDQATPMMSRGHINSCVSCHNVPFRDMGGGITIQKNSGSGRNTPHAFGGGVVEQIGEEIRSQLLAQADQNRDGWVSLAEAQGEAWVAPVEGQRLSYGQFGDGDHNGQPDLNSIVYVWYVDKSGKRIPWARNLQGEGVAGYNFEVQVFGHGQRDRVGHGALSSTLRAVTSNAWDMHSGLQAHDPTASTEVHHDGLCKISYCGAQQYYTGFTRDVGTVCNNQGISLDDPDRDGVIEEISEGDLDLIEFQLLNHPRPAEKVDPRFQSGQATFAAIGCTECHQSQWRIPHDRRWFDVQTQFQAGRLTGRLHKLSGDSRTISGIYSDFRHHDLGPEFTETQYDGSRIRSFRTSPLWGVGSTAPYGHDGASLCLDDVIRRHGGQAEGARSAYLKLSQQQCDDLLHFLRGLVLYSTETLPCDVDGDGRIAQHFMVAGQDTGLEVFNPEWLFRHPGQIEGLVEAPDGGTIVSRSLTNLDLAYGLLLRGLVDRDHDGFPDLLGRSLSQRPVLVTPRF
jgi:hypothetical protein